MQLRVRGPSGQATIKVEPDSSVAELQALLAGSTGVQEWEQEIKSGFPPRPLQLPDDRAATTVAALGIQAGDSLTVTRLANATPPAPAAVAVAAAAAGADPVAAAAVDVSHYSVEGMSEDEQLARALALSMEEADNAPAGGQLLPPPPQADARTAAAAAAAARAPSAEAMQAAAASQQQQRQQQQAQQAARPVAPPPRPRSPVRSHPVAGFGSLASSGSGASAAQDALLMVPLPDGRAVVRRIIASDNSCLFNSVGYVMERSRARAPALRSLIAQEVASDPFQWNEAVLGKHPPEYCSWIQHPDKWGGAIELSILSRHYQREIAAFDIQTKRCDVYGQDAGYSERAMVIYDGLHYDALAVAAYPGAPEGLDTTVVPASGPACEAAMAGAAALVARAHEARQFTDTANFTLRCGVCKVGLKGEKEAVEHAKKTGHTSFTEY